MTTEQPARSPQDWWRFLPEWFAAKNAEQLRAWVSVKGNERHANMVYGLAMSGWNADMIRVMHDAGYGTDQQRCAAVRGAMQRNGEFMARESYQAALEGIDVVRNGPQLLTDASGIKAEWGVDDLVVRGAAAQGQGEPIFRSYQRAVNHVGMAMLCAHVASCVEAEDWLRLSLMDLDLESAEVLLRHGAKPGPDWLQWARDCGEREVISLLEKYDGGESPRGIHIVRIKAPAPVSLTLH